MAVGASPIPTRYRVTVGGLPLFVRCGADILLTGLSSDLEAEARCPVCAAMTRIEIRDRQVVGLRPATALLHVVEVPDAQARICVSCDDTELFDTEACLREWRRTRSAPRAAVWTPQAYLDRCAREPGAGRPR